MLFMPISEARNQLSKLAGEGTCTLTQNGRPVAVLMDYTTFESLQALLAVTRDPDRFAGMIEAHERFMSGEEGADDVDGAFLLEARGLLKKESNA
jgi:prevent-host-death family protein